MEHVMYPERVASEIHRVLRLGGFVYSEVPFLQAVHEGAYDFTRYTLSGHRRLFEEFSEISAGMVAGPGTVLVWAIEAFGRSLFRSRKVTKLISVGTRFAFAWLRHFDYFMRNHPLAVDGASCTYFYGQKLGVPTRAGDIIERYGSV
jgi:hypothetical protein